MNGILGIETSCDETGVAVVEDGCRILSNYVASQIDIHAAFGGVVPEIASRQHTLCISQLTLAATTRIDGDSNLLFPGGLALDRVGDLSALHLDAVAATSGPGLMGSLLVGVNFAKAVAFARRIPFVPVHHIEGHIFSAFLSDDVPEFPFLALIVSGGHTCLIDCPSPHAYEILGTTRDDAVGESFDKVARLLDLPYPGGPSIQKAAELGNPHAFAFPRAMAKADNLEFSYSGLKTAVLYELRKRSAEANGELAADLAASFQYAAIDILLIKTKLAIEKNRARRLVLAGGVAANQLLRQRLQGELDIPVHMPPLELCVDNGAMIAAAAHSRLAHGLVGSLRSCANPALALNQ